MGKYLEEANRQLKLRNDNQAMIIRSQQCEIDRLYKELAKSSDERLIEAQRTILDMMSRNIANRMRIYIDNEIINAIAPTKSPRPDIYI